MSLQPVNPHASHAGPDALAFCNMSRQQGVSLIPLDADKTVLQFDTVEGQAESQATRCLVTQGKNGVSIRTIQGRMSVNNQVCKDAWLKLNDEISCGNIRLRLIQKPQDRGDASTQHCTGRMADGVYHITAEITPPARNDQSAPLAGAGKFFGPFPWENERGGERIDSSTMCLPPDQIQKLLAPSVYGSDESAHQSIHRVEPRSQPLPTERPTPGWPNSTTRDATDRSEANWLGQLNKTGAATRPSSVFDLQIVVVDWHTSVRAEHLPALGSREPIRGVIIH